MRYFFTLAGLLLILGTPGWGQKNTLTLEMASEVGAIYAHTPKFKQKIDEASFGLQFDLVNRHNGRKNWHHLFRGPSSGFQFSFQRFGNNDVFGEAFAIIPHVTFPIVKGKRWGFDFRMGGGIGYVTKRYEEVTNPKNVVIGSYVNSAILFQPMLHYVASPRVRAFAGFAFTHYSNGASQFPNLGINLMAFKAGVSIIPSQKLPEEPNFKPKKEIPIDKRFHLKLSMAVGRREAMGFGGPKYPVYMAMLEGGRAISRTHRMTAGICFEYRTDIVKFVELSDLQDYKDVDPIKESQRWSVTVGDELLMGKLGFSAQVGVYLHKPLNLPSPYYFRLGLRYYLLDPEKHRYLPHLGVYLKSHTANAEYFGFGFGMSM